VDVDAIASVTTFVRLDLPGSAGSVLVGGLAFFVLLRIEKEEGGSSTGFIDTASE
jgi:hypothetical protein